MYIDDKENRKMCPSKIESNSLSLLESTTETKVSWIQVLLRYRANFSFKLGRKKVTICVAYKPKLAYSSTIGTFESLNLMNKKINMLPSIP